jgi:putative hydrolase of the HAD superfamily
MGRRQGQILLCDADDTLWENNGYFLDALVKFLDLVEARGIPRLDAERKLREVEAVRTRSAGYGSLNYAISLCETWELLLGPIPAAVRRQIENLGRAIYEHPIELLPGVAETTGALAARHELWIVTKGHYEEQLSKIQRCGIAPAFSGFEILPEKREDTFQELVDRRGFDPARTWMIGNSPRSDMNPASAIGLKTIHIPHRTIWEFEIDHFKKPPDLSLSRFPELLDHF